MKKVMVGLMVLVLVGVTMRIAFTATKSPRVLTGMPADRLIMATVLPPVQGVVTHLLLPASGSREGLVRFTLATKTGPLHVMVGPVNVLTDLGLQLDKGDAVTVSGVKVIDGYGAYLVARDLTAHGNTYSLRTSETLPAWDVQR